MSKIDFKFEKIVAQYNRRQAPINTLYGGSGFLIENEELRPTDFLTTAGVHTLNAINLGLLEYFYSTERWIIFKQAAPYNNFYAWDLSAAPVSLGAGGAGKLVDFVPIDNRIYLFDGTTIPRKYFKLATIGHQCVEQGVEQFADLYFVSIAEIVGGGTWAGGSAGTTYYYKLSWGFDNEQETIEGNANTTAKSQLLNLTTNVIRLTVAVPVIGGRIPTHVNVYRRAGASGDYQFIVSWTTTGLGALTINDAGYTATVTRIAPTTKNKINFAAELGVYYANRLWACTRDGNLLYYSGILEPDSMQTGTPIKVGAKSDYFTRLIAHPNFLVIVKQDTIWIIEGYSPADFRLTKLPINMGSLAMLATILVENYIYFANSQGIYRYALGGDPEPIQGDIQEYFDAAVSNSSFLSMSAVRNPITGNVDFTMPGSGAIFSYNHKRAKWVGKYGTTLPAICLQLVKTSPSTPQYRMSYMVGTDYIEHKRSTDASVIDTTIQLNAKVDSPSEKKLYRFMRFTYSATQDITLVVVVVVDGVSYTLPTETLLASGTEKTIKLGFTSDDLYINMSWSQNPLIIKDVEMEIDAIGSW